MAISAAEVKKLRDKTGLGMMQCKKALTEAGGDIDKAMEFLRKQGLETAAKKAGRATGEARIGHYIHNQKIGVMVEVACETDFVAKSEDFQSLLTDLAMQVAASNPAAVSKDDVPADLLEKEKDIYRAQFENKPAHVQEKILEGKLGSFYEKVCLLEQPYVKDPDRKVQDRITDVVAKLKENINVLRFVRMEVGEGEE